MKKCMEEMYGRNVWKKVMVVGISAVMAAGMITGCGSSQTTTDRGQDKGIEKTKIVFWHPMGGPQEETINRLVSTFNSTVGEEKGIEVTTVYQGKNTELSKKLKAAVQAKDMKGLPDVTLMSSGETGYMKNLDLVVKGEDILKDGSIGLSKADFQTGMLNSLTSDQKIIGLPFAPSAILFYYNKDAFKEALLDPEKAPRTIKELGEYSAKLTKRDGDTITQYGFGHAADSWTMSSWIGQQNTDGKGYSLFGDHDNGHDGNMTKVVFDENGTMKHFLELYTEANKTGHFKYKEDSPVNDFAAGNVTMILASSASLTTVMQSVEGKFELGVAKLPQVDESATGGVSFGGSAIYPLNKGDDAKLKATYEFMKFLYTEDSQMTWHKGTGYLPCINAVYDSGQYKNFIMENPLFAVAAECVKTSNPNVQEPMCGVGGTILTIVKDGIISALDKSMTIDDAVASMAKQCNDALKEYNDAN